MRIVAGVLGGRRLIAPKGLSVRPTPDKVREALFSILGDLEGKSVLDLYSGTGAIAIEALSRGAHSACSVEKNRAAIGAIEKNREALGLSEDQLEIIAMDADRAIAALRDEGRRFQILFADPPYAEAVSAGERVLASARAICTPGARVVIEHATRDPAPRTPEGMAFDRTRRYGDTALSFYVNNAPEGDQG
jgi:16S rRNA (guanine966-N2)-methyltransferase